MKMQQNYRDWFVSLDKEKMVALADGRVWAFILVTFVVIIYAASSIGIAAEFFQLQFVPTILCLIPVAFFAVLVSSSKLRSITPPGPYGALLLTTSAVFQLFMWSLVCFSEMPGAAVMAALPILLAAYHGEFFLFSLKYLWGGLTTIFAIIGALILAPDNDHRAIVIVGGIISLGAAFTMGGHARLHYNALKERDDLRAAVEAQTLLDQVRETEQTQNLMVEIRGTNHDAGNALSGILMNLELIQNIVNAEEITDDDVAEMREMSVDLAESSKRLRDLIEKGRQVGKEAADKESVNVLEVAKEALEEVRGRYPNVQQTLDIDTQLPSSYFLKLHGGALALNRILLNLMINAHEGNGHKLASDVRVNIKEDDHYLNIEVMDNGPGFGEDQLKQSLANVKTTKENGTGLGLYTSLRLISANHGSLNYANNPEGGANVKIRLPRQAA